ncbi:glycosyl hydrolase family 18 protein [Sulfobacillus thermosulfidooxidans]|uniref:glycosyl hydrolase family 18 protein n=1 Tax=Sulfobacillus thermosulfidooxidans TaxID=28034 RepID=UPI0006B40D47|nr:glycosyl hydrolase family 18 protein [Sulfobacillus thermosulfidooxidans]
MKKRHLIPLFASFLTIFNISPLTHAASAPYASQLVIHGPQGNLKPGTSVTITAQADGHGSTPQFQFWMESTKGWTLLRNYSTNNTINLGVLPAGSYIIAVYALDPNQLQQGQYSHAAQSSVVLNIGSQVSLSAPSTLLAGQSELLQADATNLISPVYQWWWQNPEGQWKSSGPYQSTPTWNFTPHQSGLYHLIVYAKDPLAPNDAQGAVWSQTVSINVQPISLAYGYFHVSSNSPGHAWYDIQQHASAFNVIAPLWYTYNPTSNNPFSATVSSQSLQTVMAYATSHRLLVWPTIQLTGTFPNGWWASSEPQNLISTLVKTAVQNGYNGYTLDFEGISAAQGPDFTSFVKQLAQALHQAKLTLTVDVMPLPNSAYDYARLAKSADYLDLLAYPEYSTTTPSALAPNPGPTAGAPWVDNAIHLALQTGISPSQLLLGVALYGQSWTYTNQGFQGGEAITSRTIAANLSQQSGQYVWDPTQQALEINTGTLAVAPPAPLSFNPTTFNPLVQNLQFLLNAVLLRYAISHQQTPPALLATDGGYGQDTEKAVAQFQQEFNVDPQNLGTYGPHTAQALQSAIDMYNIGQNMAWDENTESIIDLLTTASTDHLGGMTLWRLGYQSPHFWTQFTGNWPS